MDKILTLCFTGISASGKTTCANILQGSSKDFTLSDKVKDRISKIGLFLRLTTCTTRSPRKGEVHGVDYFFLNKKEFEEGIEQDKFIEYSNVFGNYYGLKYEELNKSSIYHRILIMDPQGIKKMKKANPSIETFYFDIPMENSLNRMNDVRGDNSLEIEKRMKDIEYFLEIRNDCDYVINGNQNINLVLEELLDKIENILRNH